VSETFKRLDAVESYAKNAFLGSEAESFSSVPEQHVKRRLI